MARQQSKDINQKHQAILSRLLKDDDNKYCVDCDAKGPRWASWNIGVFLCIRCAGIHRNLGVHISKVKSINLDSWTAEQIACVEDMGNSRARAVYEANLPDHYKRPATSDSAMEQFIRAKYEHKKYIAKEWVPPKPRSVPSHYYDTDEPKKENKKPTKTVLTIPGAAAGTSAVPRKPAAEKKPPAIAKPEESPGLMVDFSTPASQAQSTNTQPTSTNLLADIFTSPPAAAAPSTGSADLLSMSSAPAVQSGGDNSEDLFKVAEEKSQSAKDSIMALFGNNAAPQPGMGMPNAYNNMPTGYSQPSQGMQGMQPQANPGMMPASYPYSQHPQQMGPGNMMGNYSTAGQPSNMMMASQPGVYQQPQQGMMGMVPQNMIGQPQQMMGQPQQMMGQPQQMMGQPQQIMGQPQQMMSFTPQQQLYAQQQMQAQMASLSLNQQQMGNMAKQGTLATGNSNASWGNAGSQTNGQTLNGALWN